MIERVDDIRATVFRWAANRFKLFKAATAGEDRHACQQPTVAGAEHVVAPENCAAKGLLPGRGVSSPAAERAERFLQPAQQSLRRKQLDSSRGQLDRQWETVDALADAGDGRSVVVRRLEIGLHRNRALDEEAHRLELRERRQSRQSLEVGQREWRNGKLLFA